jgi:hypothetical protein
MTEPTIWFNSAALYIAGRMSAAAPPYQHIHGFALSAGYDPDNRVKPLQDAEQLNKHQIEPSRRICTIS